MNVCPLCVEEQADPASPKYKDADHRGKPPIPCPEHGDPRILYPENQDAFALYRLLDDYHIVKEYKSGGQHRRKVSFDLALALALCTAYGIEDVPDTIKKIKIIHSEVYDHE